MIPYGRQSIGEDDIAAVVKVLRGEWLTQGPTIEQFENALSEYVGAEFAVAFSSCTAALHGAAWAAGLGPDSKVYTSPLTFMASANAARYVGAQPALVDIEEDSLNLNLNALPSRFDGLIAVHYAGLPVDLRKLQTGDSSPVIIEDAAHALGASTPEGPVGNCVNSDMACFSFHPVKPITTAEGGMVTTNNVELAERLRRFRSHGIVRRPEKGNWFYEISELGYHYRMTDIQAALGLSQLQKIDRFIATRTEIANRYREAFRDSPQIVLPPEAPPGFVHGYHLFPIRVTDRRKVFDRLQQRGVGVQVHYVPIHHHPISSETEIPRGGLPVVDRVYSELISLPIHPQLTDAEQETVIDCLLEIVSS